MSHLSLNLVGIGNWLIPHPAVFGVQFQRWSWWCGFELIEERCPHERFVREYLLE